MNKYVVRWSLESASLYVYDSVAYAAYLRKGKEGNKPSSLFTKNSNGWFDKENNPMFSESSEDRKQINIDLLERDIFNNFQYISFGYHYANFFWMKDVQYKAQLPLLLAMVYFENNILLSDNDICSLDAIIGKQFTVSWNKLYENKVNFTLFKYEINVH